MAAFAATGVNAQKITTWTGGNDEWDVPGNWSHGVPTDEYRAVIDPATFTIVQIRDPAVADSLELGPSAILQIYEDVALTLDNNDHNAHTCPPFSPSCTIRDDSIVDGWIELRDDTGTSAAGKIVFTTNDHIFEGERRIEDVKSTGAIEIAGDIRFTNRLTDLLGWAGIHGSMTIKGLAGTSLDGELRNEGRVQAIIGAGSTLTLAAELSDVAGAQWITSCEAILLFKREAITLDGDFLDNPPDGRFGGGSFTFEADVWTCGTYYREDCSGLIFSNNSSFSYADFQTGGFNPCSNPGVSSTSPATCVEPFIVGTNEPDPGPCGAG